VSKIVGHMLLGAARAAGHSELVDFETAFDAGSDEILVRLNGDEKSVCFRIPNHLFDPVQYAQAKWPGWFVPPKKGQLDLFNQE